MLISTWSQKTYDEESIEGHIDANFKKFIRFDLCMTQKLQNAVRKAEYFLRAQMRTDKILHILLR